MENDVILLFFYIIIVIFFLSLGYTLDILLEFRQFHQTRLTTSHTLHSSVWTDCVSPKKNTTNLLELYQLFKPWWCNYHVPAI